MAALVIASYTILGCIMLERRGSMLAEVPAKNSSHQFKPGQSGNPAGHAALLKDAIILVAIKASNGDLVACLTRLALENPDPFQSLLGKVLPIQIIDRRARRPRGGRPAACHASRLAALEGLRGRRSLPGAQRRAGGRRCISLPSPRERGSRIYEAEPIQMLSRGDVPREPLFTSIGPVFNRPSTPYTPPHNGPGQVDAGQV
jgi:hypothetical protein